MQPSFSPPSSQLIPPPPKPRRFRSGLQGCLFGCGMSLVAMAVLCSGILLLYVIFPPAPTNVLIMGNDARPGTGEDQIARTDSIMVLGVHPGDRDVSLLSLPRDTFIQSPDFGSIRANLIVRNAELTEEGSGAAAMMSAMENTFDIPIDHYVRLSFDGFVDVVNAVGGVTIDVPTRIVDYSYPTHDGGTIIVVFEPGSTHMDGETALIYARTRHNDSDYSRAERQQQVLDAVMGKIANPLYAYRLPAVIAAIEQNVDTDMNLLEMASLAPGMLLYGSGTGQLERYVITPDDMIETEEGAAANVESLDPWLDKYLR